jgi:hypothetical protein
VVGPVFVREAAGSGMLQRGILSVTVPGSAWGWDVELHRFGTKSQPAIDYAKNGLSRDSGQEPRRLLSRRIGPPQGRPSRWVVNGNRQQGWRRYGSFGPARTTALTVPKSPSIQLAQLVVRSKPWRDMID